MGSGGSFSGIKQPGRKAYNSSASSAEVKAWSYTSILQYVFMTWCLIKQWMRLQSVVLYLLPIGKQPAFTHCKMSGDVSSHHSSIELLTVQRTENRIWQQYQHGVIDYWNNCTSPKKDGRKWPEQKFIKRRKEKTKNMRVENWNNRQQWNTPVGKDKVALGLTKYYALKHILYLTKNTP
jgi:hypothetical protein